jgi:hypothetical protein
MRRVREQNGAFGWFLAHNPEQEESHVESFMAESWADYLRQVERMTNADHAIEERARSFHQGREAPALTTLIAEHPHWQNGSLTLPRLPGIST